MVKAAFTYREFAKYLGIPRGSVISRDRIFDGNFQDYRLAGPTCDSPDMMEGPFVLPSDIGIGDWIVFENAGAYSQSLRSDFNGFGYSDILNIPSNKD